MHPNEKVRVNFHPQNLAQSLGILLGAWYFFGCVFTPSWQWLDGVNLFIHEAGHLFFRPLGEFWMIAGGSLTQVLMPGAFIVYFVWTRQLYAAAWVCFWLGESFVNVSVYAADAIFMQLPLLGGSHVIHDWNYLLTALNLLEQTTTIARLIQFLGFVGVSTGLVLGLWASHPAVSIGARD